MRGIWFFLFLVCASLPGADSQRDLVATPTQVAFGVASRPAFESACMPGIWRYQARDELHFRLLPLSHVLLRHSEMEDASVPLNILPWSTDYAEAERTRSSAFELARQVRQRMLRGELTFEEAALQFSDDPLTKFNGGALGVYPISQLSFWPLVLDCLEEYGTIGQVTVPVETNAGVHLFLLRPMPREDSLEFSRLVVGHQDAEFLEHVSRDRAVPKRTRRDALRIANEIRREIEEGRSTFDRIVRIHSDHRDFEYGGDCGRWRVTESSSFPREIEKIASLAIGEVSEPIETAFGYQIFRREPPRKRDAFAVVAMRVAFDRSEDGYSRHESFLLAERSQSQLPEVVTEESTYERIEWIQGRGPFGVERELLSLEIGSKFSRPIESDDSFLIGWRVAPQNQERLSEWGFPRLQQTSVEGLLLAAFEGVEFRHLVETIGRFVPKAEATSWSQLSDRRAGAGAIGAFGQILATMDPSDVQPLKLELIAALQSARGIRQ